MDMNILKSFLEKEINSTQNQLRGYIVNNKGERLYWRHLFYRIEKFIRFFINGSDSNRLVLVPGLRGTGKTTLLAQIYFDLIEKKKIKPEDILYLSLDRISKLMKSSLYETISCYEQLIGERLEDRKKPLFLLIDEAHYDKEWDTAVKVIFDRSKSRPVFILVTGSSALALQKTDTVRRVQKEPLFPLSFIEYYLLKFRKLPIPDLKEKIESILFNSKDAKIAFNSFKKLEGDIMTYWKRADEKEIPAYLSSGSLGFALELESEEVFRRMRTLLDRIIYEDLPNLKEYDRNTLNKIWNLLLVLSTGTDSLDSISKTIGMAKPTLVSVLDTLTKSELIFPIKALGSPMTQVRKISRYIFVAPIIRASLLWESGQLDHSQIMYGKLLEDTVASYLYRIKKTKERIDIRYDSEKGGADFIIINKGGEKIVLEVGYGSNKGEEQVLRTMKKTNAKYGIILSDKDLFLKEEKNILYLPKKIFLLM